MSSSQPPRKHKHNYSQTNRHYFQRGYFACVIREGHFPVTLHAPPACSSTTSSRSRIASPTLRLDTLRNLVDRAMLTSLVNRTVPGLQVAMSSSRYLRVRTFRAHRGFFICTHPHHNEQRRFYICTDHIWVILLLLQDMDYSRDLFRGDNLHMDNRNCTCSSPHLDPASPQVCKPFRQVYSFRKHRAVTVPVVPNVRLILFFAGGRDTACAAVAGHYILTPTFSPRNCNEPGYNVFA